MDKKQESRWQPKLGRIEEKRVQRKWLKREQKEAEGVAFKIYDHEFVNIMYVELVTWVKGFSCSEASLSAGRSCTVRKSQDGVVSVFLRGSHPKLQDMAQVITPKKSVSLWIYSFATKTTTTTIIIITKTKSSQQQVNSPIYLNGFREFFFLFFFLLLSTVTKSMAISKTAQKNKVGWQWNKMKWKVGRLYQLI